MKTWRPACEPGTSFCSTVPRDAATSSRWPPGPAALPLAHGPTCDERRSGRRCGARRDSAQRSCRCAGTDDTREYGDTRFVWQLHVERTPALEMGAGEAIAAADHVSFPSLREI